MRRWCICAALAAAACGSPAEKSDWERTHEAKLAPSEESISLPTYPRERELVEFFVAATSEFRFFIDSASLSVDKDIVRYVLVARSAAGANNVSFEGMRCAASEVRIYALGRDGGWARAGGGWRPIEPRSVQRWHNALHREYFCPQGEPIGSAREGVDALRRGGHPFSRGLTDDIPRGGGAAR